jgi:hypothetical protein
MRVPRQDPREETEDRRVPLDACSHVGAQHLHRDLASVREASPVNLRHARGRDRHVVELGESRTDGRAEVLLDDAADAPDRERRQLVLQDAKLVDGLRLEQIGARAHHLAELHERRAERRHRPPEHPPAQLGDRTTALLAVSCERRTDPTDGVREDEPRDDDSHHEESSRVAETLHCLARPYRASHSPSSRSNGRFDSLPCPIKGLACASSPVSGSCSSSRLRVLRRRRVVSGPARCHDRCFGCGRSRQLQSAVRRASSPR